MRLLFVLAGVSLVFGAIRVSCAQSPWRAVYTIDGQGFICREGVPYFQSEHERRDDDKIGHAPWKKGSQNSIYFELSSDHIEGTTTIKSLGPGNIDDKDEKFYPASREWGYDPSLPGYLTADYSTDPPSVTLEKQPGKYSTWKISRAEKEGRWYIENDNGTGKRAWLVPESKPVFVYPGGGRQEFTVEYYRALLSYESRHPFKIGMANGKPGW